VCRLRADEEKQRVSSRRHLKLFISFLCYNARLCDGLPVKRWKLGSLPFVCRLTAGSEQQLEEASQSRSKLKQMAQRNRFEPVPSILVAALPTGGRGEEEEE